MNALPSSATRVWAGVALLVAGFLGLDALRVGAGAVWARPAQAAVLTLTRNESAFDEGVWNHALTSLAQARAWNPHQAEYPELAARLDLIGAGSSRIAPKEARRLHDLALTELRAVTSLRPQWPYGWSHLAVAKAAAGSFDAEFDRAVVQAARLGPREIRVRRELGALFLFDGARARTSVAPALGKAFVALTQVDAAGWIDRADRAGAGQAACERPDLPPLAYRRCVDLGWVKTR